MIGQHDHAIGKEIGPAILNQLSHTWMDNAGKDFLFENSGYSKTCQLLCLNVVSLMGHNRLFLCLTMLN